MRSAFLGLPSSDPAEREDLLMDKRARVEQARKAGSVSSPAKKKAGRANLAKARRVLAKILEAGRRAAK